VIFLTIFTKKKYQKTPQICDDFQSDPREANTSGQGLFAVATMANQWHLEQVARPQRPCRVVVNAKQKIAAALEL